MTDNEKKLSDGVSGEESFSSDSAYTEAGSTIFTSTSAEPAKQAKKASGESKKKLLLTVTSAALVCALAAGIFAVVKLAPASETSSASSSSGSIVVNSFSKADISSLSVKGESMSYTVLKGESSSSSSGSEQSFTWTLKDIDKKYTSSTLLESYVNSFAALKALREVSVSEEADYGFDKPRLTLTAAMEDGSERRILIGNEMSLYNGYYLTVEGEGKCYIVSSSTVTQLESPAEDFVNTTLFAAIDSNAYSDYFSSSTLMYFDYVNIGGSNFSSDVRIICDKADSSSNYYHMTQPKTRVADAEALTDIFALFTDGVYASGAFSYSSDTLTLREYGLDAPVAVLTAKVGDALVKISVGREIDGYYAITFNDNKPIYKIAVTNSAVSFVDKNAEYFVSSLSISDNIKLISSFRFFSSDGFDKTVSLVHDSEDPTEWTASCGGTKLDTDSVKYLYQHVMRAVPLVTLFDAVDGESAYSVTVSYVDGSTPKTLKFVPIAGSTRRYTAWINDQPIGEVAASLLDSLKAAAETVTAGGTIESPVY